MERNQAADAQELYDGRSDNYDESHHPRFARHMVELIRPQSGDNVLDLACGTGLVSFPASTAVGPSGSVTGVDISSGMLAQAEAKKAEHDLQNVSFHRHSITELGSLDATKDKQFDIITCCSALVLLEHPADALIQWVTYLKPGGRLIVDVTHSQNLTSGVAFERVGRILEKPVPWYRLAFQKPDDLREIMEAAGLHNVDIKFMSQLGGDGTDKLEDYIRPSFSDPKVYREFEIADAGEIFDKLIDGTPMKSLASPSDVREKARAVFKEEWAKTANAEGKVQEIDGVFVRKIKESMPSPSLPYRFPFGGLEILLEMLLCLKLTRW